MDSKVDRIKKLEYEMSSSDFWNDRIKSKKIIEELDILKNIYHIWNDFNNRINDLIVLNELAKCEDNEDFCKNIEDDKNKLERDLFDFEIRIKLDNKHDKNDAIVSIHAGAGGTESCDWAQILMRMYLKWAESRKFETEIVDILNGDEAGIKSITMVIKGDYAYGFLQSEIGVHRLVRISPFDSNKRRHTSFSSVDVIAVINDNINIIINDNDIRIDTYRSSGAGGQHVNKTNSAVRITHLPTKIIVQSQNDRSQTKNKIVAMKLLKARLYEFERE
ncbi:MAG: peptide chain release factor 2, partial [Endomicrobium sp.]|nr:peptide chain release factor 2 [Endomicrobium sp.]